MRTCILVRLATGLLLIPQVATWRVDRRCLGEGVLSDGDGEVEGLDEEMDDPDDEFMRVGEGDKLEWNGHSFFESEADMSFGNETVELHYSNTTRNLQSGRTFNLKLYWRPGACWQDEWIERKWCMECRKNCQSGDVLEIQRCSHTWKQRFQWQGSRLKIASKNMCLTRSSGLRLKPCGSGSQGFRGYQSSGAFELKPSGNSQCLSQHHHPKAGEKIELTNCGLAASHNTNKWNVYWPSGGGGGGDGGGGSDNNDKQATSGGSGGGTKLTKLGRDCTPNNKCGKCEGDCDKDADCKSGLTCRQRYGQSALDPVPGCSGTGVKGIDYCY